MPEHHRPAGRHSLCLSRLQCILHVLEHMTPEDTVRFRVPTTPGHRVADTTDRSSVAGPEAPLHLGDIVALRLDADHITDCSWISAILDQLGIVGVDRAAIKASRDPTNVKRIGDIGWKVPWSGRTIIPVHGSLLPGLGTKRL